MPANSPRLVGNPKLDARTQSGLSSEAQKVSAMVSSNGSATFRSASTLVLLPLFGTALSVTLTDGNLDAKVDGRFRHTHPQQVWIPKRNDRCGTPRCMTKGSNNSGRNRTSQRRWHCVANLPSSVPLCFVKPEPVGETMKPGHFAHGDATWVRVMNRPGTCKRPPRRICPCSQRVTKSVGRKLIESRNRFHLSWRGRLKTSPRNCRMLGPQTRREYAPVPFPQVAKAPWGLSDASRFPRIPARPTPPGYGHLIGV